MVTRNQLLRARGRGAALTISPLWLVLIRGGKDTEKMSPKGSKIARPSENLFLFLLLPVQE